MNVQSRIFQLERYLRERSQGKLEGESGDIQRFLSLCDLIQKQFFEEAEQEKEASLEQLRRQKRAIIGYPKDVAFYKDRIRACIQQREWYDEWHPLWYESLEDAIFHEVWGLAGVSGWCYDTRPEYRVSSSAKIIGDHIYYYLNGSMQQQPQTISAARRQQLKRALLLQTPGEREGGGEHEVYMKNGIRITIFTDHLVKQQDNGDPLDVFVLRKYIMPEYSLQRQVDYKTIPQEAVVLLRAMAQTGFNVNFTGAVRSGKTTMMACYQKEENPILEGLMIETDPELPMHQLMPEAPIVQIIADGEELEQIIKSLLRADPAYIIMAEARDAIAFNVALDITDRGTRRSKLTTHFSNGKELPMAMARKIAERYGGDPHEIACKIARNIHYVIEMTSLPQQRNQKRLKGIYELRHNTKINQVEVHQICFYDFLTDRWHWKYTIGEDKIQIGREENWAALQEFQHILQQLATMYPVENGLQAEEGALEVSFHGI